MTQNSLSTKAQNPKQNQKHSKKQNKKSTQTSAFCFGADDGT